jgi:uncharacterized protein (DUF983 family)
MDERDDDAAAGWPTCPQCGARRMTTCPICRTSGTDFAEADRDFLGSFGGGDPLDEATPMSCGCGSAGCGTKHDSVEDAHSAEPPAEELPEAADPSVEDESRRPAEDESLRPGLVLTCPVCDEPFAPRFLRRCEWCGHEFPDGAEMDLPGDEPPEEINNRTVLAVVFLALLGGGLLLYFMFLMPSR